MKREKGENTLLVPKSLTNWVTRMGVPDQSGEKINLRGTPRLMVRYLYLTKLIGRSYFCDHSPAVIRELWRFMFFVRRVTILTSSAKSSASASGTSQKSFKERRNKSGPPSVLHVRVCFNPPHEDITLSEGHHYRQKKSAIDGVKFLGKVNVINCVIFIQHARHRLLEDQQVGEAGPTGYETMLVRGDCQHFTNKGEKGDIQDLFKDFTYYRGEAHGAVVLSVLWDIHFMHWVYNGQAPASRRSTWGMHLDSSKTLSMD